MLRTLTFFAAALLAAPGCGSMTAPSPAPVRVVVQATPPQAGDSGTATFTLRVENITPSEVDLTFPSGCQVLPYFVDRRSGEPITPRGGGFACTAVITHQSLQPGESFANVVTVAAGNAPAAGRIVLPAGDYAIYARLEDSTYKPKSDQVQFSVK